MKLRTFTIVFCFLALATLVNAQSRKTPLLSPADMATGVSETPSFQWDTLSLEVDSFQVQLSKAMDFADTMASVTLLGTEHSTGLGVTLDFDSTYYWRVITFDSFMVYQEISDVWSFTVRGVPPGQPTNVSPTSASIDMSVNPTLTWSGVADADDYHVHVSTFHNFSDTAFYGIVSVPTTSITVNIDLEPYTTYYWRVGASNQNGVGTWSQFWNFTTLYTGLFTPEANFGATAYPNPSEGNMVLSFEGQSTEATVVLYDLQGKEVKTIAKGFYTQGTQQIDVESAGVEPGMYLLTIQQNGQSQTLKVVFK